MQAETDTRGMGSGRIWIRWLWAVLIIVSAACGSDPAGPTPPPTPPLVTPPVIRFLTVATTGRVEAGDEVTIAAEVDDTDVPPFTLRYEWSANAGTFDGTGQVVKWRAAKGSGGTPVDVVIRLTVVEPYQALENGALVNREYRVTSEAAPFRLNDSEAEIAKMTVTFLVDYFGDSTVSPDACLVDFTDSCRGKEAERKDITGNRSEVVITSARASVASITVNPDRNSALVVAPCHFEDRERDSPRRSISDGQCRLTTVYENGRWWLCTSNFSGTRTFLQSAFGVLAERRQSVYIETPTVAGAVRAVAP